MRVPRRMSKLTLQARANEDFVELTVQLVPKLHGVLPVFLSPRLAGGGILVLAEEVVQELHQSRALSASLSPE